MRISCSTPHTLRISTLVSDKRKAEKELYTVHEQYMSEVEALRQRIKPQVRALVQAQLEQELAVLHDLELVQKLCESQSGRDIDLRRQDAQRARYITDVQNMLVE